MELKGQTVLITGASDGIGKSVAIALSKRVKELILLGKDSERLDRVKFLCIENGISKVTTYAIDFLEKDFLEKSLMEIKDNHSNVSILINNAGIWQKMDDIDNVTFEVIENVIRVNLISLIKVTKVILPVLRKQPAAKIINIISKSGHVAQKGQSVYTASKYGVRGFTEVLREDLKGSNIDVTALYQGGTKTDMFKKAGENIPVEHFNKFIDPDELAQLIVDILQNSKSLTVSDIRVNKVSS